MRKIRRDIIILIISVFISITSLSVTVTAAYGAPYTLNDLYMLALEKSDRIKISEEDVYIAEKNKDKALALLFPRISVAGSYTGYSDRKQSDSGSQIQPFENATWSIRLDQTFSTSGRELVALKVARELIDRNRYDLESVKEAYIFSVTAGYFDVLRAAKLVDIGRQNIDRLKKYRDAAATRLRIGEVTKTAVLRSEAELSAAESELIRADGLLGSTKAVLQRLVGIEGNFSLFDMYANLYMSAPDKDALTAEPVLLNCGSSYIECLRDIALKERPELKSLTIQKNITSRQVSYVKGANWPSITLEGVYTGKKETPQSPGLLRDTTYGGIRMTLPLFEGGLRMAEAQEAMARDRQADYALADLKKSISAEVESAYYDYAAQKGIVKSSTDQLVFARENYGAVSRQFDNGLAQSIDVVDANTALVTAERQHIQALYNYQQSIARLRRVTGLLLRSIAGGSAKE